MSRLHKYKLLLDEQLPFRNNFPRLNSIFSVRHVTKDFHKPSIKDPEVYELAKSEKRILITLNIKDFKNLASTSKETGIIGIPPHWTIEQIDTKLTALLCKKKPGELYGKYTSLADNN